MLLLRLVHFLAMATWFGSAIFAVRDVRTALVTLVVMVFRGVL